jgi:general secretion pathway protein G
LTLIELMVVEMMIVVAVIGVLASIAVPLFTSVQSRARTARVEADLRTIATAVSSYAAHMNANPRALGDLTVAATNAQGWTASPFLAAIPDAPAGWSAYTYTATGTGMFWLSSTGDSTVVTVP